MGSPDARAAEFPQAAGLRHRPRELDLSSSPTPLLPQLSHEKAESVGGPALQERREPPVRSLPHQLLDMKLGGSPEDGQHEHREGEARLPSTRGAPPLGKLVMPNLPKEAFLVERALVQRQLVCGPLDRSSAWPSQGIQVRLCGHALYLEVLAEEQ